MAYIQILAFALACASMATANPGAATGVVVAADRHAYPAYQYAYGVSDARTGDQKTATETRDGGIVKGSYSLLQPDGITRTVNYVADPVNGFQAQVLNSGVAVTKAVVAAAPVIVAAAPVYTQSPVYAPIRYIPRRYLGPSFSISALTPLASGFIGFGRRYGYTAPRNYARLPYGGIVGFNGRLSTRNGFINGGVQLGLGGIRGGLRAVYG